MHGHKKGFTSEITVYLFPMCLFATDSEAIAETVSASSTSCRRASLSEHPSVEAERFSERQYLPTEEQSRGSLVRTASVQLRAMVSLCLSAYLLLTLNFNYFLHRADSVGIWSLLQHLIGNRVQLEQRENNITTVFLHNKK